MIIQINEINVRKRNLIPELVLQSSDEALLQYEIPDLKRCTKCILPETMPFITSIMMGFVTIAKTTQLEITLNQKSFSG